MQAVASTSRQTLQTCTCRVASRSLASSAPSRVRKSWFMTRDRRRRQDSESALEERLQGPSEFASVDPMSVDISLVDRATARPARETESSVPWYLQGQEQAEKVDERPWYVEASYEGIADEPGKELELAPEPPPPPPAHLPSALHDAYQQLTHSLWVDPYTTVWIDVKSSSDDGTAHTDWIVACTVNEKRERAMAGALGELKQWVRDAVLSLYPQAGEKPLVSIEGYRRRYPDWMLFDGGSLILHLFSKNARETWSVEEHYLKGSRARTMDVKRDIPHPFFSTQSRGPASMAGIEGL